MYSYLPLMYSYLPLHLHIHQQQHIPVKLTWIFPGAPLIFNGAPGNIQGNKPGMQAVHVQTFRVTTHHWIPLTKGKNCVNTPLIFNGAPGNIQGNKPGMQAVHVQTFRVTTHHWIPLTKGKNCVNTHAKHVGDVIPGFESTTKYIFTKYGDEFQQLL